MNLNWNLLTLHVQQRLFFTLKTSLHTTNPFLCIYAYLENSNKSLAWFTLLPSFIIWVMHAQYPHSASKFYDFLVLFTTFTVSCGWNEKKKQQSRKKPTSRVAETARRKGKFLLNFLVYTFWLLHSGFLDDSVPFPCVQFNFNSLPLSNYECN